MKAVLIHLDEATCKALDRLAPAAKRRQAQFIREAIRRAIREAEFARMRAAYEARPDSEAEADDWSSAEEYRK